MALIQCPECSQEVSDRAEGCPKCGFPVKAKKPVPTKCDRCNTNYFMDVDNVTCPKCGLLGPPINTDPERKPQVEIADINMSFWSMVSFMVWWVIASIPAFIILSIIGGVLYACFIIFFGTHS